MTFIIFSLLYIYLLHLVKHHKNTWIYSCKMGVLQIKLKPFRPTPCSLPVSSQQGLILNSVCPSRTFPPHLHTYFLFSILAVKTWIILSVCTLKILISFFFWCPELTEIFSLLFASLPLLPSPATSCTVIHRDSIPLYFNYLDSTICCFWVTQSWPTLCHPMDCSIPGFPVLHRLPELAQTHVHRLNYKFYQFLCALLLSPNSLGSYFVLFCCNASSCNSSRKDLCVVNFEPLNNLNSIFFALILDW